MGSLSLLFNSFKIESTNLESSSEMLEFFSMSNDVSIIL